MSVVEQAKKPIVWTIAGADCSGGAGIAADIKTGHLIGVEVCHLITANTVQNAQQLVSVNPVAVDILNQQVNALIDDKPPAVIKIGLLVTTEQVAWLTQTLARLKQQNPQLLVVFDPVGQASTGGKFSPLTVDDFHALFAWVDVITPNLPEAKTLSKSDSNQADELAAQIKLLGVNSVIVKGGHTGEENAGNPRAVDYCLHQLTGDTQMSYQLSSARIDTDYSHGGGCSFASAIAAYLAQGYLLRDAFTLAKSFINQGLQAHQNQQGYYGAFEQIAPLTRQNSNSHFFPKVEASLNQQYQHLAGFAELGLPRNGSQQLGLYPVVDSVQWLEKLLPLNLNIIQLRIKNLSGAALEQAISRAVALCKNSKTRLFINDYWQLAIKHGAYGVHIGQEDLQDADLAQIQAAGLRLGISTHGCYEFLLAQQLKPSYLAVGAIFPTKTKDMTGQIQGVDNLSQILTLATDIPVVAIGGINHQRAEQVWQTSVDSIAVVTAITEADDYQASVATFKVIIN